MESSTERFFKGFSLEDYRLQVLMKRLEKEKKQCLDRLREETHVFKMSIRPPVKCQEECWSQYGEIFHANGDKRETASMTHINMEDDLNSSDTGNKDNKTSNKNVSAVNRQIQILSKSTQNCSEMDQVPRRRDQQRIRNRGTKNKDSRKKAKPAGLTLLEILCGDFENGTYLGKRTQRNQDQKESGGDNCASSVEHGSIKKAQTAVVDKESLVTDSEKLTKTEASKAQSYTFTNTCGVIQSGYSENMGNLHSNMIKSKLVGTEGFYSNGSPKELTASETGISPHETIAWQSRSTQNLNWTSEDIGHNIELEKIQTTSRQLYEGKYSKLSGRSASLDTATKNERSSLGSDHPSRLTESSLGVQTPESSRFVHFKERRKTSKRKSKQGHCVHKSRGKEKLNRTRSLGVKLYQVDGLQFLKKGISEEEIERETRQKMDQFFARVEHTKTFQTSTPRWRCTSGVDSSTRKTERRILVEQGKRPHGEKKEHGYHRAHPWPTQVWT